ncbi:MAG: gamma-glutamyl-gamma-aminobutyrate hydrolase family protein [Pseudomonadota bacterium]
MSGVRPAIGVLCCNEQIDRPVQVVASRFVVPLGRLSDAVVFLVPALDGIGDVGGFVDRLDGLLLTGSRSHVAPHRYGGMDTIDAGCLDERRDAVALSLAGRMIERGRPVFGICRGFQEINVLFGGTLSAAICPSHRRDGGDAPYEEQFDHRHGVDLVADGALATATGERRLSVTSVHEQGIDRLGDGLTIEALASDDGLVEAISARPAGGDVVGVQWHPEWDVATSAPSRAFFAMIGRSLRGETARCD